MYCRINYPTKKALINAVKAGETVEVFQPGPFAAFSKQDGEVSVEGPHYPEPHKWYARVRIQGGKVVKVLK